MRSKFVRTALALVTALILATAFSACGGGGSSSSGTSSGTTLSGSAQ